jgi:ATP-dependent HslUV protease ATP-binding subunit HslU
MIGPTGVGKTEIARRLAQLVRAPFIKVEATKYTEVGYHGRDVESMIRDLLELAVTMVRTEMAKQVRETAEKRAEDRLLDLLLPAGEWEEEADAEAEERRKRTREKLRRGLKAGKFENKMVEMQVEERAVPVGVLATGGFDELGPEFQQMLEKILPSRQQQRYLPIKEARKIIIQQETDRLLDKEKILEEAVKRTEKSGIVFLDELDKVCGPSSLHGPDVSRQGVQRDLMPIVEGCTVATRHGPVKTDHILFIAAGAFHMSKPADLMPELQGRFPIRVELAELTKEEFVRILTEPENAIIKQHTALLEADGVKVSFGRDALDAVAEMAWEVNRSTQNIGARRLYTVLEKVVEQISFDAPDHAKGKMKIDGKYVREKVADIVKDEDLNKFIL